MLTETSRAGFSAWGTISVLVVRIHAPSSFIRYLFNALGPARAGGAAKDRQYWHEAVVVDSPLKRSAEDHNPKSPFIAVLLSSFSTISR